MGLFASIARMQSGIMRSSAQSPPPITFPARTLATGSLYDRRHDAMAISAAP